MFANPARSCLDIILNGSGMLRTRRDPRKKGKLLHIGRLHFNKKENLLRRLILGGRKRSGFLHPQLNLKS